MDKIEKRVLEVTDFEIEERENKPTVLKGYAVRFDSLSQDLGGFKERFKQNSFSRSLSNGPDILALAQHDNTKVLGRRSAGTLTVEEDPFGVRVTIIPPDTSYGKDIVESIRRKDISGMSFGFVAKQEEMLRENNEVIREIRDADLHEVSVVTSPAYLSSKISVRSETLAKLEEFKAIEELKSDESEVKADEKRSDEKSDKADWIPSVAFRELELKTIELKNKLNA